MLARALFRRLYAPTTLSPIKQLSSVSDSSNQSPIDPAPQDEGHQRYYESYVNAVQLLGRTGVDAQLRGSEARPVVTFSLATTRSYKNNEDQWKNITQWHRVACFSPHLVRRALQVKKGDRLYVTGSVGYTVIPSDNLDSVPRQVTTIYAEKLIHLSKAAASGATESDESSSSVEEEQ